MGFKIYDNKPLFVNGKIAVAAPCCCDIYVEEHIATYPYFCGGFDGVSDSLDYPAINPRRISISCGTVTDGPASPTAGFGTVGLPDDHCVAAIPGGIVSDGITIFPCTPDHEAPNAPGNGYFTCKSVLNGTTIELFDLRSAGGCSWPCFAGLTWNGGCNSSDPYAGRCSGSTRGAMRIYAYVGRRTTAPYPYAPYWNFTVELYYIASGCAAYSQYAYSYKCATNWPVVGGYYDGRGSWTLDWYAALSGPAWGGGGSNPGDHLGMPSTVNLIVA